MHCSIGMKHEFARVSGVERISREEGHDIKCKLFIFFGSSIDH
jgi:hypothetical protein